MAMGPDAQAERLSAGSIGLWGRLDHLDLAEAMSVVRWCETMGLAAFWTPEVLGREPFVLQAILSGATRSILLGTAIASVYARDAATARAAAATISELSGGRFVLGLGVSHAEFVAGQRRREFGAPIPTMRAYLEAYRAAPYEGSVPFDDPLILLAALRERMLGLAATVGGAFGYYAPVSWVPRARATLDSGWPSGARRPILAVTMPFVATDDPSAARAAGRAYVGRGLALAIYREVLAAQEFGPADLADGGSDRLIDELVAWGSLDQIRQRLDALRAGGADHVALVPLAPSGRILDAHGLEGVASLVDSLR